jgi:hypothetical protein
MTSRISPRVAGSTSAANPASDGSTDMTNRVDCNGPRGSFRAAPHLTPPRNDKMTAA